MSFDSVGAGLHGLLACWIGDRDAREAVLRHAWTRAVGPAVAEHTTVLGLAGGILRVRIEDQRWIRPLRGMERRLLDRLGAMLGPGIVRGLRWIEAGDDPTRE